MFRSRAEGWQPHRQSLLSILIEGISRVGDVDSGCSVAAAIFLLVTMLRMNTFGPVTKAINAAGAGSSVRDMLRNPKAKRNPKDLSRCTKDQMSYYQLLTVQHTDAVDPSYILISPHVNHFREGALRIVRKLAVAVSNIILNPEGA